MKIRTKHKLSSSLLISAACFMGSSPVHAENWTAYTYSAVPTTAAVQGMKQIVTLTKEETSGKLDISLHLGGTLQISSTDITQAVGDGLIDLGADLFFSGNVPIARVLNLPMLIDNDEEWDRAYKVMEPYLKKGFSKQGATYLASYRYPAQTLFTTFKIQSLADIKGHKIRVTSPEQGAFISAFDGTPITLPGSEVPTSLERGVIDGVVTASAGGAKGWHDLLKYNYRLQVNYPNSAIIVNADTYEALDDATRDTFTKIVETEAPKITKNFSADEKVQQDKQADAGMKIVAAQPEDIIAARKKMADFWEGWAEKAGPEHVEALDKVRQALGK